MIDKKFRDLIKKLEQKKRNKNMLEGELLAIEKEMRAINIDSIEQAEKELSNLRQNKERIAKKLNEKLNEFENNFKDDLNE